jgi:UDP-N-acetylmuramoylalanine--D-glutamate ligase
MNQAHKLYQNKKVLILGLGLNQGGVGAAKFFAQAKAIVRVTDLKIEEELKNSLDQLKNYPEISYTLGEHKFEDLDWADLIIRNPALKPDNPYLKYALDHHKQVEMDIGIFLQFIKPKQIIGITGTKGKSTTASLIYEVLKKTSLKILFAGNIGKSVLDLIPKITPETVVILELSSFQLQAFHQHHFSPKWAVVTNIFPDHLNYHENMENYVACKKAIAQYQTKNDFLFLPGLGTQVDVLRAYKFLDELKGKITYFKISDLPNHFQPLLPGEHNLNNMAAALSMANNFGINENEALTILKNFQGVEFRLQLIKEINGIKIYNDSAASNPESTIQALHSLPQSILIVGGMNKNLDYQELTQVISNQAKMVFFLAGDATEELQKQFKIKNLKLKINKEVYTDLEKLLQDVKKVAKPGDIILFSPGATSFNLFQNEFDRGRKFNEAVNKIFP